MDKRSSLMVFVLSFLLMIQFAGCSGSDRPSDPKSAVISFFGAMEKDDKAALAHLLDLGELMKTINEDYALQTDSPRVFTNPMQILDDLTGEGQTKTQWFKLQRIIGATEMTGEVASVEVTFIDKEGSRGYRTKFGLHVVNTKWKIYSFKIISEPGQG